MNEQLNKQCNASHLAAASDLGSDESSIKTKQGNSPHDKPLVAYQHHQLLINAKYHIRIDEPPQTCSNWEARRT